MRARLVVLLLAPLLTAGSVAASATTPAPEGPAQPRATPALVTIKGPDVSSYQHPRGTAINWAKVAADGHAFAIVKATEGSSYVNGWFRRDYAGIRKAGMVRGSYHFARPRLPIASSALEQAQFYVSRIGVTNATRTLPPALDLEESGGLTPTQLVTWASDFLLDVRALTGRTPMIYTYPWFWRVAVGDPAAFARYPLWMASYHGTVPDAGATLWQYTAGATVSGIRGGVDMSRLLADPATWATLSDGSVPTEWPALAPAVPVAVTATPGVGTVAVRWMPPDAGSAPIGSYRVTLTPADPAEAPRPLTVGPTAGRAVFTGLRPGASFAVSVQARNAVGVGPAATAAPVTVLAATQLVAAPAPTAVYGDLVTVRTVLTRADGTPLENRAVAVWQRDYGATSWTPVTTVLTDASGVATAATTALSNGSVRFTYGGEVGLARAVAVQPLLVRKRVTAAFTGLVLRGAVTPTEARTRTALQLLVGGAWKKVAATRTGPRGGFRFVVPDSAAVPSTWRLVVASTPVRTTGFATIVLPG